VTSRQLWHDGRACDCGNSSRWEDVTDVATGTAYVRCRICGRHHLASAHGYIDWRLGLFLDRGYPWSAWTQRVSAQFFGKDSGLTHVR